MDMPVPRDSEEIPLAVEELVACVDDPQVAVNGSQDSYHKCIEAMWRATYLTAEYMAKRLGMTPLQQSLAMEQLLKHYIAERSDVINAKENA